MPEFSPQRRFWDDSVDRLLSLYDTAREAKDSANALVCFDRLAEHRFRELAGLPDFDPSHKAIVSAFQPKSGGTFLHNRMLELGYKEFWWCFPHVLCHSVCYAGDEALKLYLTGGCTCHTHAQPHPNILAALDRAGVEKIWVHLRNPAECVVSAYHHYRGEGHGEGDVGEQRRGEAVAAAELIGIQAEAEKSEFVREHIEWHVDWAANWLRYAQDRPELVVFSYHRELADPQTMLQRVFRELGIALRGSVSAEPMGRDRFRRKDVHDWRIDVRPSSQVFVEQRVMAKLSEFPALECLWS